MEALATELAARGHHLIVTARRAEVLRSLRPDDQARTQPTAAAMGGVFGRWEEAVGAAVALHVQPVKLDGTTLVVDAGLGANYFDKEIIRLAMRMEK